MFFRKIIFIIFLFSMAFSCQREDINFDYRYWLSQQDSFPNVRSEEFIMAQTNSEIIFKKFNLLDPLEPEKILIWKWVGDSTINTVLLKVLECDTDNLDIIIPENLYIVFKNSGAYRYVKGYTYPLFDMYYAFNQNDSSYYYPGVGNHKYVYSYTSPVRSGYFNGYLRKQIHARIDSFAGFGDIGKQVDFTFTHTFGITEIELKRILYSVGTPDTVSHYVLKRIG